MTMISAEREVAGAQLPGINQSTVRLPFGLLGFEKFQEFILLGRSEEAPFLWLQVKSDQKLAFLVAAPQDVVFEYCPHLSEDDVRFLALDRRSDALVLNIVTLSKDGSATINLKGPIVINAHTRIGKQIVPLNAADYSVQHPLPVTA
jgi:flagellar assembly factor FliW